MTRLLCGKPLRTGALVSPAIPALPGLRHVLLEQEPDLRSTFCSPAAVSCAHISSTNTLKRAYNSRWTTQRSRRLFRLEEPLRTGIVASRSAPDVVHEALATMMRAILDTDIARELLDHGQRHKQTSTAATQSSTTSPRCGHRIASQRRLPTRRRCEDMRRRSSEGSPCTQLRRATGREIGAQDVIETNFGEVVASSIKKTTYKRVELSQETSRGGHKPTAALRESF